MTNDDLQFTDDRPISTQEQDLLDRAGFAQRLALAISSWKNQESLVISLTGGWGSGKTSIKNMTLDHLAAIQGCQVIEFNPWQWAGQDSLSSAFFAEISRVIQRKDASDDDKKLAKLLRSYSRRLNTGASLADGTAKLLPMLLASTLATTLLGSLAQGAVAQITLLGVAGASALGSLSLILQRSGAWLARWAKNLDEDAKDSALTLSQLRENLQKSLSIRNKPLLVVLDDLDRLSAEQMKGIFQLVKAHMDFANVVFLLLFQRDTVEQGLRKEGFDGADYLEKIIQVPFSVPAISSSQLEALLFRRLNEILAREPQLQQRFEQDYWSQVFRRGMRPFFSNLRHVYRYSSTLAFHCRLLRGTEIAEVNAVDLFALECLRIFAPETYAELPKRKVLLTGSDPYSRQDEPQRARITQLMDQLVSFAPVPHQEATRQLLLELFPTLDWVFKNTTYDHGIQLRWLVNSRVCCDEVFDRYFEMSIPEQDVPNSLLHELCRRITEPEPFTSLLTSQAEDRQAEILQRLLGLAEEFPLDQPVEVVRTLLHAGEYVGRNVSFTNWPPRQQVARLLRIYLQRFEQVADRSQPVIDAFVQSPGLVVTEQLLAADYALRREGEVGYFDDIGLEQLKSIYMRKLREKADSDPDAFLADEDQASYLYDLNRYGEGGDEGRRWVEANVNSPVRFLQFAQGQVNIRTSHRGGTITRTSYIPVSSLAEFLGLERWTEWAIQLDSLELDEDQCRTLDLVKDALAQSEKSVLPKDSN
ncbi:MULTISPECIES: KAP family P-loop NTPase fold protein [Pseudomonas]|uniref:KAP family P-loop NTPase fold protein n=1 Tax=Pseudomonas nitroreducens TaxID=46680 RepID=UPI001E4A9B31|nr:MULTISPECIES: P-loop NTPase fold protein [Pseudomonas]MCE4072512.1 KAP family NTPase [Pseudomonas nitritireducens]MCE4081623.1 KAP family NTPase [Pseudomonas nitroreducens]